MNFHTKIFVLMLCLLTSAIIAEPPPEIAWARKAGGTDSEQGRAIAVDTNGNIYVTGVFSDTTSFGTTNLVSADSDADHDQHIAKPQ